MAILGKEDILKAEDTKTVEVNIPEWGGSVLVRPLWGEERDWYEGELYKARNVGTEVKIERNTVDARAKLASLAIVDEDGNRIFSDKDVKALSRKSAKALDRVCNVIRDISGLTEESEDEAGKNSENPDTEGLRSV